MNEWHNAFVSAVADGREQLLDAIEASPTAAVEAWLGAGQRMVSPSEVLVASGCTAAQIDDVADPDPQVLFLREAEAVPVQRDRLTFSQRVLISVAVRVENELTRLRRVTDRLAMD